MSVGKIQNRHEQCEDGHVPQRPTHKAQEPENGKNRNQEADISLRKDGARFAPCRQCFAMHTEAHRFARGEEALSKLDPRLQFTDRGLAGEDFIRMRGRAQPLRQCLFACPGARAGKIFKH
jgi:hypothetical protein